MHYKNHMPDMGKKLIEQKTIIKLKTHITGQIKIDIFYCTMTLNCLHLFTAH